ncbi:MAG: hypothetical protein IT458_17550 [Planctomycetes bacterium]|nr:hypothetical protein [Planctomycetota bacterium]
MNSLAGVDEAGLGPILGPLVVAGVAMTGPAGADPYALLARTVSRTGHAAGKVRVADSKKVHQGPRGLAHLERTALAFLGAWRGEVPGSLAAVLELAGADRARLARCPWYRDLDRPLPLANDRRQLELQSHLLARDLAEHEVCVQHIALRPVDVEEFNEKLDRTANKGTAHFETYAEVLLTLLNLLPPGAHLVADRCGGRMRYGGALRRLCPGVRVEVEHETALTSSYRIHRADPPLRLTFATQGEDRAFPTALASCMAKYLRELMVERLNAWFGARLPGLRPTAGYYVDGQRFLADVEPVVRAEGLARRLLLRSR